MMFLKSIPHFGRTLLMLWVGLLQPGPTATIEPLQPPGIAAESGRTAETVVRELGARSANWVVPPAALETLEYDFISGSEVTRVRIKRGERRRSSVWMGATLRVGFHNVMQAPERYSIELKREEGTKTLTLVAKPKDEKSCIGVEVGNGVENSWRGYFSHGARETSITVDAERFVPLEEQTGRTTVRYSDWDEAGPGSWVPGRIDVLNGSVHYRMNFAWLGNTVWLLRNSESITPEVTAPCNFIRKMKDQLGDRKFSLNSREHATSRRGSKFAWVHGRSERERDQPFDLALKHYARIGCQFDLPLFRYRQLIDSAAIAVKDGTWDGRLCQVATVSIPGGDVYLGYGTMFAFTSWSYVHHTRPSKEVIYIDVDRKMPVHETLTSLGDGKVFEIDFSDYIEVEPGQWAPRSIRIESKDYFTCEYQFQLVAGVHWMLQEVVSWFKPEEKSRVEI